jgi:hypothetical protein
MLTIHPNPLRTEVGPKYSPERPPFFQTEKFLLPALPTKVDYMHDVAKDLSLATGRRIEFKDHRDNNCSVWGDFGSFIIQ